MGLLSLLLSSQGSMGAQAKSRGCGGCEASRSGIAFGASGKGGVDSFSPSPAALISACLLTLDSVSGAVDSTTLRIRWEVATRRTGQYEGAKVGADLIFA